MRRRSCSLLVAAVFVFIAGTARGEERDRSSTIQSSEDPDREGAAPAADREKGIAEPEAATLTGQGSALLKEVVVEAQKPLSAASSQEINAEDFKLRPHTRMIQLLNNIPGLIVAQHQGGNKAPQYLIRGFDADHGTDFAVFLDDLPVNMVTHGHGQGYADINFIIPETIERYQLYKGPYFPQFGDFANAGALNLVTKEKFDENFLLAEGGSFDTQRYVAGLSPELGEVRTLIAGQAFYTNGPFLNDENLSKYNFYSKFTLNPTPSSTLSLAASVYQADWDGSGQVPLREVKPGRLDRFGSIDPTEGGRSDRETLDLHWNYTPSADEQWSAQVYGSRYKLGLWSDFTFFKDTGLRFIQNPDGSITDTRNGPEVPGANYIPGDEIEQNDQRYLYGGRARYARSYVFLDVPMQSQIGFETRNDVINVALHRAVRRHRFFSINRLQVDESSFSGFLAQQFFLADWMRLEVGVRGDYFLFHARNRLPAASLDPASDPNFDGVRIDGYTTDGIVSPKVNLVLTPLANTDVYLDFGNGFHSNDARNAILGKDTSFRPLTLSTGYELGARTRQFDALDLAAAIWLIDLESELVFSGDGGNQETGAGGSFEPAGPTRRWGIDFELRYRFNDWLYADYDLSYADPRFKNGDAIALAPTFLMNGGLTAQFRNGFSVALRGRFLDTRPAIEDRSLSASGYFLLDLVGSYRWRNVEASVQLLNLTDTDWREAQFSDTSCVRGEVGTAPGCLAAPGKQTAHEVDPDSDIHFTPGNPIGVIAGVKVYF